MKQFFGTCLFLFLLFGCRTEPKTKDTITTSKNPESLQLRLFVEPDGLSPILARNAASRKVWRHLYTRLLEVDPVTLDYVPYLATSKAQVETLDNGNQKFTFDIHPDAKWSDGTPLTIDDLLFSYKILKHPTVKTRYDIIADLIADIVVDTKKPNSISFIADECHITLESSIAEMFIYPEHIYDPQKTLRAIPYIDFKDKEKIASIVQKDQAIAKVGERMMDPEYVRTPSKFVTAGPYIFVEWITGQRIQIKKNENWWGKGTKGQIFDQKAKSLTYQIIPDNTTAMTQLANGELDALSDLPADLYDEYKSKENLQTKTVPTLQTIWLTLNTKNGLLTDKNVRKALAYACNEETIIKNAKKGYGDIVTGPLMPGTPEYNTKVPAPSYDPDKATALLKASGWSDSNQDGILDKKINGKQTNLTLNFIMSSKSTTGPIIGELLKNSAKKVGFDIKLTPKDSKVYRKQQVDGNFDIVLQGTSFNPGLYDLKGRWHTASFPPNGINYCRFGNKESDDIIDQIRTECDNPTKRTALYHQIHSIVAEEQPVIFLYNGQMLHLINKRFDNIVVSSNRPGLYEEFLTLK